MPDVELRVKKSRQTFKVDFVLQMFESLSRTVELERDRTTVVDNTAFIQEPQRLNHAVRDS